MGILKYRVKHKQKSEAARRMLTRRLHRSLSPSLVRKNSLLKSGNFILTNELQSCDFDAVVSEMTYTVSSGTLNSSIPIPYQIWPVNVRLYERKQRGQGLEFALMVCGNVAKILDSKQQISLTARIDKFRKDCCTGNLSIGLALRRAALPSGE